MKIAITIADTAHMALGGGEVERKTVIIEVQEPPIVTAYLKCKQEEKPTEGKWCYLSASLSIVEESTPPQEGKV